MEVDEGTRRGKFDLIENMPAKRSQVWKRPSGCYRCGDRLVYNEGLNTHVGKKQKLSMRHLSLRPRTCRRPAQSVQQQTSRPSLPYCSLFARPGRRTRCDDLPNKQIASRGLNRNDAREVRNQKWVPVCRLIRATLSKYTSLKKIQLEIRFAASRVRLLKSCCFKSGPPDEWIRIIPAIKFWGQRPTPKAQRPKPLHF